MLKYNVVAKKNPVTKEIKYYAQLIPVTPLNLSDLCEDISAQCTVTRHDVKAVISAMEEHITRALQDGKSVRLGDLGSFHPTLTSTGADTADGFTASLIKNVNVRFVKNGALRYNFSTVNPRVSFASNSKVANAED